MRTIHRDRLALRQDANHPARLPATWGVHHGYASCVDCGWPAKLVAKVNQDAEIGDLVVYVARHGDPLGRPVNYPDATWVTDQRSSTTKRHLEECPLAKRSSKKLHREDLVHVAHFPVCKACLELLSSGEEQGEE